MLRRGGSGEQSLEFPLLINGFDSPVEFFAEGPREEFLDGDVEFLGEDDR